MTSILSQTILILLGLSGFLLASHIHNKKITKKRLICPRKSDCNSVITSDYSKIFGIPIEVLGMVYYAFSALSYGVFYSNLLPQYFFTILFLISIGATLFSLYLIYVQAFKIKQWCLWCIGSAIITLLICALSFLNSFALL